MIALTVLIAMLINADTESGKCYEFPEYAYMCSDEELERNRLLELEAGE